MIFFLSLGNNPKEIKFEIIKNFQLAYQDEWIKVFNIYNDFEKFYKSYTNLISDSLPKLNVNFENELLIGVFLGQRPSRGYSINVDKVVLENKKILVQASEICPKKDQIVLMVITYPSIFIKIPKYDYPIELKLNKCQKK